MRRLLLAVMLILGWATAGRFTAAAQVSNPVLFINERVLNATAGRIAYVGAGKIFVQSQAGGSNQTVALYPQTTSSGWVDFQISNNPANGTEYFGTNLLLRSHTDSITSYFNPKYRWSVTDSSTTVDTYEMGSEGNWNAGSSFFNGNIAAGTGPRIYLWNNVDGRNLWYIDYADGARLPGSVFKFQAATGATTATAGMSVQVGGQWVTTDSDQSIFGLNVLGTLAKNDANTRTFYGTLLKPTLNPGGSNTTTTLNVLGIDTTNTTTTGLTTNLVQAAYGGTTRFRVTSDGTVIHSKNASLAQLPTTTAYFAEADGSQSLLVLDGFASNAAIQQRRSQGTAASPTAVTTNLALGINAFVGYNGAAYVTAARMRAFASETFTGSVNGGHITLDTVTAGATALSTKVTISSTGDVFLPAGTTGMTAGFIYFPSAGGTPTGVPASTPSATGAPGYIDTTNNKACWYYGGAWKCASLT